MINPWPKIFNRIQIRAPGWPRTHNYFFCRQILFDGTSGMAWCIVVLTIPVLIWLCAGLACKKQIDWWFQTFVQNVFILVESAIVNHVHTSTLCSHAAPNSERATSTLCFVLKFVRPMLVTFLPPNTKPIFSAHDFEIRLVRNNMIANALPTNYDALCTISGVFSCLLSSNTVF